MKGRPQDRPFSLDKLFDIGSDPFHHTVRKSMKTQIETRGNTTIIALSGKYDISEIIKFEAMFKDAAKEYPERIALNLSELEYIDSSGIGSIIRCINVAPHERIDFVCCDLNEYIMQIFRAAKLDQYLPLMTLSEFNALFSDAH